MTADDAASAQTGRAPRILVGIDGSQPSIDALEWAGRQAKLTNSSMDIVMTWDWPASFGWAVPLPADYDPAVNVRELLSDAEAGIRAKFPDIEITTHVVEGHPAPVLVEASKNVDLLVVGNRGHGEFVGMLIGSVSEFCATNAHCPVLVHRSVA